VRIVYECNHRFYGFTSIERVQVEKISSCYGRSECILPHNLMNLLFSNIFWNDTYSQLIMLRNFELCGNLNALVKGIKYNNQTHT
jgi:hypothetical protein